MLGLDVACKGDRGGKGRYMVLGLQAREPVVSPLRLGKEREGRKEERVWQEEGRIQGSIHLDVVSFQMPLTPCPDHSAYVSCLIKLT